eukprot:scaffold2720_cov173-Amphora_coffeaeformis.AAC.22
MILSCAPRIALLRSLQQPLLDAGFFSAAACAQQRNYQNPGSLIVSGPFTEWLSQQQPLPLVLTVSYIVGANLIYLTRRAYLRKMTIRELWRIRTMREPGVSVPLYLTFLIAWQTLVIFFPIIEPIVRFGWGRNREVYST